MQRIERVAILGAGAMGAYYASRFQAAPDFRVSLVASGKRAARLAAEGLTVNGTTIHLPLTAGTDHPPPADLIIVALKHYQLATALPELRPLVGEGTVILSVLNGLDSETLIATEFGWDKVLYCIAVGIDAVRVDGAVTVAHAGRLIFGEASNRTISSKVRQVQEAFDRAGLPWETPPDMLRRLWWKFMVNVGINQASAVLRAAYGTFQRSAEAQAVVAALMAEVMTLAACQGIDLGPADLEEWQRVLGRLAPEGKTSMLQDIEAGRRTEVEIFAGKVVELSRIHGVPTPANELMLHLIRALEEAPRSALRVPPPAAGAADVGPPEISTDRQ